MARAGTRDALRVVAYHGVPDPEPFSKQMAYLAEAYRPVSGADVTAAWSAKKRLPANAVWVTFDDGRPDVVRNALPELKRWDIRATLFVVAGVVDTTEPFWWEIVERAVAAGVVSDAATLGRLKLAPDDLRREEVSSIGQALSAGAGSWEPQLTTGDLERWLSTGMEVGNHSWDHPCLNNCSADVQRDQVYRAHDRLSSLVGEPVCLFAYPNGNFSKPVDDELRRLDYSAGLLFDHRLARLSGNPLAMSRLRIDSQVDLARFKAIVSGAHPALFAAQRKASALVRRYAASA
jgi:peptidoglycan/xylan/chitin deacetylase (PgdA/CDA1 family)